MASSKLDIIVQTPKDIIDKLNTLLEWKKKSTEAMNVCENIPVNVDSSLETINEELLKSEEKND